MVAGEDYPKGLWILDGTTVHADYSGYGNSASSTASTYGPALVGGASRSLIVSNTGVVLYPALAFEAGSEDHPFTLEATARPVVTGTVSEQQVIGREDMMDGLIINGTVVSFVTKYATTGEARASYDLGAIQAVHMVGVHTKESNVLYVNGEPVAEVEITPEQQADSYTGPSPALISGKSASANSLMINGVAVYDAPLPYEAVFAHYERVMEGATAEEIAVGWGGHLIEFTSGQVAPKYEIDYSLDEDWAQGGLFGVAYREDSVYPETAEGVTVAGRWETAVPLNDAGSNLYAANVKWAGTGFSVSTSRDGNTWAVAENGVNVSTINSTVNTSDSMLYVRVQFPAGLPPEEAVLESLTISVFSSGSIAEVAGRQILLSGASVEEDTDLKRYHNDWGVELRNGSITIKESTEEPKFAPKTIEVWARKEGGTFVDNLIGASPTVWRSNGGASSSYRTGEWQLRHYVFNAGFEGDIVFNGTGQIGHIILYTEALTNDNLKEIYDSYMGVPTASITSTQSLDIHEFPGEVDIYEYDWTIESSG